MGHSLADLFTLASSFDMPTSQAARPGAWPTTRITLLRKVADQEDRKSWDCFVRTYGPLIHRYCLKRGLQEADALDVVQDVLMQVSKHIGRFRYDTERGRFRGWLGTVTHRAMLKHLDKSRRARTAAAGENGGDLLSLHVCPKPLGEDWVEAFNAHIYREAVRRLRFDFTDETWRAFEATFVAGRPPGEVAHELERPVGWVYQAKSQVVRRLKAEILYLAEDSILLSDSVAV
jgi:RNA polymerase sigma-70 factor (ECF subfamily)